MDESPAAGAFAVPGEEPAATAVWEPGVPSLRAMAPGTLIGGVTPFVVYQLIHPHLASQVVALLLAGCVPALWVAITAVVQRRLEPIGLIVFVGLAVGALMAVSGGGPFAVKARDGVFAGLFGLVCLGSLATRRPLMFLIGRALSAGNDPDKLAAFDDLWELPSGARTFRMITVGWAVGLLVDAVLQLVLDALLPTPPFLVVDPVLGGCIIGGLLVATIWYSNRARRRGEAEAAGLGLAYPSIVIGGTRGEGPAAAPSSAVPPPEGTPAAEAAGPT